MVPRRTLRQRPDRAVATPPPCSWDQRLTVTTNWTLLPSCPLDCCRPFVRADIIPYVIRRWLLWISRKPRGQPRLEAARHLGWPIINAWERSYFTRRRGITHVLGGAPPSLGFRRATHRAWSLISAPVLGPSLPVQARPVNHQQVRGPGLDRATRRVRGEWSAARGVAWQNLLDLDAPYSRRLDFGSRTPPHRHASVSRK
jgi:hypothetical protein